jgi:hypothetical protein
LSQTTRRPLLSIQRPPRLTCRHPDGSGRHPIGPHSISAPRARKRSAVSWLGEMPICAYAEHAIEIRAHKLVSETAKRIIWMPSRRYGAYRCASLRPWLSPEGKPRRRPLGRLLDGASAPQMIGMGRGRSKQRRRGTGVPVKEKPRHPLPPWRGWRLRVQWSLSGPLGLKHPRVSALRLPFHGTRKEKSANLAVRIGNACPITH